MRPNQSLSKYLSFLFKDQEMLHNPASIGDLHAELCLGGLGTAVHLCVSMARSLDTYYRGKMTLYWLFYGTSTVYLGARSSKIMSRATIDAC